MDLIFRSGSTDGGRDTIPIRGAGGIYCTHKVPPSPFNSSSSSRIMDVEKRRSLPLLFHPIIESAIHASFWPILHRGPVRTTSEPFRNPSRSPSPWPASMAGWTHNIISCNEVEWRALVAPPRRSHTMGCSGGRSGNAVRWYNNGGRGGGDEG